MGAYSIAAVLIALLQSLRSFNIQRPVSTTAMRIYSSPIDKLFRERTAEGGGDDSGVDSSSKRDDMLRALETRRARRMAAEIDPSIDVLQRVTRPKLPPLPRLEGSDPANGSDSNSSALAVKPNRLDDEEDLDAKVLFPEMAQAGLDEKALRSSPLGKVVFGVLDNLFPVFKEPNWFDVYDPPLSAEENLALPYFDGFDFANSSWTVYIRHRYGVFNWLDRLGVAPLSVQKVFLRPDGKTMWSDGFYGDWYINPAINYFQFEKHFGRGAGYTQYSRGMRIFQIQRWNYESSVGRYWMRGLRSYLRDEHNYWALEGRIWGTGVKWRPYPRDQGKFLAIRDGANLTEIFGAKEHSPWERRWRHAATLPFYQAHPDQLERIEDNFDQFYTNLLGDNE